MRGTTTTRSLRAALLVTVLVSAGCFWTAPGAGPDRRADNGLEDAISTGTVGSLVQVWEAALDSGPAGDPVTSNAGVHVDDTRSAYGFAVATGARMWQHEVAAPLLMSQAFAHGDQVMASQWNPEATEQTDRSASDLVFVLDARTGSVDGEIDGAVLHGRRGTQALLWATEFVRLGGPTGQFPFWSLRLRVRDVDTGQQICCNSFYGLADGAGTPPSQPLMSLGSEWVVHAGQGIIDPANPLEPGSSGNGVRGYSIDAPATCPSPADIYLCPAWAVATDGSTVTAPVLGDDHAVVYVGTDAGTVYAVEVASASVRWSTSVDAAVTGSPALAHGSLFVPTAAGDLVVLDAATGDVSWSASTGASIDQQPAVAGDVVFTGSADGEVNAFAAGGCGAPSCNPLWSDTTGSAITGAPAVSNGQLYVGTADGRLVAFGLPAA